MLSTPIIATEGTSLVLEALFRSDVEGTPPTQATLGNTNGAVDGHFIIGDLPQQDMQASNWGVQTSSGTPHYTIRKIPAGVTTLLVAQVDFGASGAKDRIRLWVDPPAGSYLTVAPDLDVVDGDIQRFSGVFWQTQQNQGVDEIRIRSRKKCAGEHVVRGGEEDGFAGNAEPAHASAALQNFIGPADLNFDQVPGLDGIPSDRRFAHTLTFKELAAQAECGVCEVTGAHLEIGLRATRHVSGNLANNDSLSLKLNPTGTSFLWTTQITAFTGTWTLGQSAVLNLDLGALPPTNTSILGSLSDGRLEIYVQDDTGVDFVRLRLETVCDCAELHGVKFYDQNENGLRDPGEAPLAGWTLELRDPAGSLLASTTTDAQGAYWFADVAPSPASVHEVMQGGWHVTTPPAGVHLIDPLPGEVVEGLDFGNSDLWCGVVFGDWEKVVFAQPGTETAGTKSADLIIGTEGDDRLIGRAGEDCIYGLGGNDYLKGDSGGDEMHGGPGNDYLKGDSGRDVLFGDSGNDKLKGDSGDDELHGGVGRDFLLGDAGGDTLTGDEGDDRLCGNAGTDNLVGGPGQDLGHGGSGSGSVVVEGSLSSSDCSAAAFNSYPL
jgi:hypothetical protein